MQGYRSSDFSFGVMRRSIDPGRIASWGRVSERWRYHFDDAIRAREHALGDPTVLQCDTEGSIDD
eukprot:3549206-Karenia_brevis.AAC.1